jgi:hypothetical protein
LITSNSSARSPQQRITSALQQSNYSGNNTNKNTPVLFSHIRNNVPLSAASEQGEVFLAELCSDSGFPSSSGKLMYKINKEFTNCLLA